MLRSSEKVNYVPTKYKTRLCKVVEQIAYQTLQTHIAGLADVVEAGGVYKLGVYFHVQ